MQQKTARRLSAIVGGMLAVIMALSVVLPMLSQNATTQTQQIQPTDVPVPTFPAPIADLNSIQFDQVYLHPSGLYTVAQPTGWLPTEPLSTLDNARATFSNATQQSIIQVDVDKPATSPVTLDDVDARWTSSTLASSWSRYSSWTETGERRRENDQIIMDFELKLNNQTFVARQIAWTDGEWIYSARVVTPENATDELLYVLDKVTASVTPNKEFATTPFDWQAYFDSQDNHIIRYPPDWVLADSAPGKPTSITSGNDIALRVESQPATTVADQDAARAWVETERPGAIILSVGPVTREDGSGFAVAYAFKNVDGESQSGLVVLLNSADKLHVANLRFAGADVDLNSESGQEAYSNLAEVMSSFNLLPALNLAPAGATTS
jgi:hypothetical protein